MAHHGTRAHAASCASDPTRLGAQPGEGVKRKTPTAGSVIVEADISQTNGSMTVVEFLVPPNDGPAVHSHIRGDEGWCVLGGDFRFTAGDAMLPACRRASAPVKNSPMPSRPWIGPCGVCRIASGLWSSTVLAMSLLTSIAVGQPHTRGGSRAPRGDTGSRS